LVWRRARPWLMWGSALLALLLMVRWGGTARPGPLFWLGVAVLASTLLIFGGLVWWLFLSPLSTGGPPILPRSSLNARQIVSALVTLAGLMFITGTFWDEVWHRQYGIGAVLNDFFWPPHMLFYGSMGLMALFALGGLFFALRGTGGLRQRFRAEPLIGFLGLAAAYLAFSAPSDLVWHEIYGLDITAWSLPHLLFGVGNTLVMLSATMLQASLTPRRDWRGLGRLRLEEVLMLMIIGIMTTFMIQVMITEWDGLRSLQTRAGLEGDRFLDAFWSRPEWLYPAMTVAIAAFVGQLTLHVTRRAGAATLVALFVLGFRALGFTLTGIWGSPIHMTVTSQLLIVPPALALDLWYAARLRNAEGNLTLVGGNLVLAAAFMLLSLPIIPLFLLYPRIIAETVPMMVLMGVLLALWSGWVGARLGGWVYNFAPRVETAETVNMRAIWIGVGALAFFVIAVAVYIVTAPPPVS
jgi:hypothetical protein